MAWKGIVGKGMTVSEAEEYIEGLSFSKWRPSFMVLHNTGAPKLSQWHSTPGAQRMKNLENYYKNQQGWSAGPHFFVADDLIWAFTPANTPGVHAPSWNGISIGIEMVGDYATEDDDAGPGLKVKNNTIALLAFLHAKLGIDPQTLRLHKEDKRTTHDCPGRDVAQDKQKIIDAVIEYMGEGGGHPEEIPIAEPAAAPEPAGREGIVKINDLNIREQASASSRVLGTVDAGARVRIIGEATNGTTRWLRAVVGDKTGWVAARYVADPAAPAPPKPAAPPAVKPPVVTAPGAPAPAPVRPPAPAPGAGPVVPGAAVAPKPAPVIPAAPKPAGPVVVPPVKSSVAAVRAFCFWGLGDDLTSHGMTVLNGRLNKIPGVKSTVQTHHAFAPAMRHGMSDSIIALSRDYRIVLIGNSMGALAALMIARDMKAAGREVALLHSYDTVRWSPVLEDNVRKAVGWYNPFNLIGGGDIDFSAAWTLKSDSGGVSRYASARGGTAQNVNLAKQGHFLTPHAGIDDIPSLLDKSVEDTTAVTKAA